MDGSAMNVPQVIGGLRFYLICLWLPVVFAQSSSTLTELLAWRAALVPLVLVSGKTIMDFVSRGKHVLGPLQSFKLNKHHSEDSRNPRVVLDLAIMTVQLFAAVGVLTYLGAIAPMLESFDWNGLIRPLGLSYLGFAIFTLLKDVTVSWVLS